MASELSSDPQDILESVYGYSAFRGNQQAIIESALTGNDSVVLMPTGGGKSLCYQIPSLLREGTGIIISPLIALMQDQVSAMEQLGIEAVFLNSTLDDSEQQAVIDRVKSGQVQLLYIAPERLVQANTLYWLSQCDIALVAIDEAHCVSQWGHDFRQDYLALHCLKQHFPGVPRMALTATATPRSQQDIVDRLELDNPAVFVSSFDRPNIHYAVAAKTDGKKQLAKFLVDHRDEAGIVYCLSRKKVESTVDWLNSRGLTALPYHAGLPAATRKENQDRFLREDGIIMVATIAFGMGIDKPDVRFVVHLNLPKSMESYYQETGRAGRDGEPANAYMLYGLDDVVQLGRFIDQSGGNDNYKRNERSKLDTLLGWCEVTSCRRRPLLDYFGETENENSNTDSCGNCDNCDKPPITWDATEAAQKFLSCVYRSQQRFGAMHLIDILRGKTSEKVQQFKHDQLSVFGIGSELSQNQWRSLARQLVVRGFLAVDAERYNALVLTDMSRELLKGEITLQLREDIVEPRLKKESISPHRNGVSKSDSELWDALRACRKRLADEHDIPPYMVFHDATLMEMMELQPMSPDELLTLNGVGESKLEKFGQEFLQVILETTEAELSNS